MHENLNVLHYVTHVSVATWSIKSLYSITSLTILLIKSKKIKKGEFVCGAIFLMINITNDKNHLLTNSTNLKNAGNRHFSTT